MLGRKKGHKEPVTHDAPKDVSWELVDNEPVKEPTPEPMPVQEPEPEPVPAKPDHEPKPEPQPVEPAILWSQLAKILDDVDARLRSGGELKLADLRQLRKEIEGLK